MTPDDDEVLRQVRAAREAIGERFGWDLSAIGDYLRGLDAAAGRPAAYPGPMPTDPAAGPQPHVPPVARAG